MLYIDMHVEEKNGVDIRIFKYCQNASKCSHFEAHCRNKKVGFGKYICTVTEAS
jgi:hypothetical protein